MKAPDFWYRPDSLWSDLLAPAGTLYARATARRMARAAGYDPGVPVVCVGNLTAGGSGKTPVVRSLVWVLQQAGRRPVALSRGYRGRLTGPVLVDPALHVAKEVGDEPLLLARDAPTIVAKDRAEGARLAVERGAGVIVMDDGFQNPTLAKTLSLVVVDAAVGFGNGRVIPAGPLREPIETGLARADALVLLGQDDQGLAKGLRQQGRMVLTARAEPTADIVDWLAGRRVVAFAGIGRPAKFFETLERAGARVVGRYGYGDHHRFLDEELMEMWDAAAAADASLVTTEKDHVRLSAAGREMVRPVPIQIAWDAPDWLTGLLMRLPPAPRGVAAR